MAFCTNCGATLPDGAAFCTSCGAKLASAPAPRPAAPTYAAPAYAAPAGYPAPAPKKKHTGLIIGIAAALLVIAAVVVLLLTGVLGSKGPTGTWVLQYSTDSSRIPGLFSMVLYEDGTGYAIQNNDYHKVVWADQSITLYDRSEIYIGFTAADVVIPSCAAHFGLLQQDGDKLTLNIEGQQYQFQRTSREDVLRGQNASTPFGFYTLQSYIYNGDDFTEYALGGSYPSLDLSFNADGSVSVLSVLTTLYTVRCDNRWLFTPDGGYLFYTFDGNQVVVLSCNSRGEEERMVFTRVG